MKLSNQDFACFDKMTFTQNETRSIVGIALFKVFGHKSTSSFTSHTSLLIRYLKDKLHD